ncbi:MAG: argininosuccinate lyase [Actinobacteria bacterium]|nr:argininosuccinate lyase [Actinomycetota bacterium]
MTGTGRLTATLSEHLQQIVYGRPAAGELAEELSLITTVDQAHLVMLAECGLIGREDAGRLLRRIAELRAQRFAPLVGVPAPRGRYLAYENQLIASLGPGTGGRLHTGRSRNDLNATIAAMRLRDASLDLVGELTRLHAVLLARARAHRDVVMPVHTHYQPALPITYGYYLVGVALAIGRDTTALRQAVESQVGCPMGAGAAAGTELPIDPARVARLLGFPRPAPHALDAVASRDACLRAVAAAAGAALVLSRLATDLQLWSTGEFGFVTFPDRLVGGSSAMPQKRNAFLLEHTRAKAGAVIGAWTAAATMMRGTPFTNAIEVGGEAMAVLWPGFAAARDAVLLSQALVHGAQPAPDRMRAAAEDGFVVATALANRLVQRGVPFRAAHHQVGAAVRRAVERGQSRLDPADLPAELDGVDPTPQAVVRRHVAGGGPGDFDAVFAAARSDLAGHAGWSRDTRRRLSAATSELAAAVARLAGPG